MVGVPPVAGTGVRSVGSAPLVETAVARAGLPSVVAPMAKKKKPRPTVVFTSTLKLVVDVNPDLAGSKSWKIKLQRKSKSKWRKVGIYRTQGAAETREFPVTAGSYRVKVYARPGFRSMTTKAYRFTPATPTATPATPIPDPTLAPPTPSTEPIPLPPPDSTAPGEVTGLSVVGRTATSISLAWTNPADADLAAVILRRAVGSAAPTIPSDGVSVGLVTPTAASVTDEGLAVDTGYAYAVFTQDGTGNTSAGTWVATRTSAPAVVSTTRVSVRSDGGQATSVEGSEEGSVSPAVSADGRWITYSSWATNLVDEDTNGVADVFLKDRDTATTTRVSARTDGGQVVGQYGSTGPAISGDGRWIAYSSDATNLVDNDTNDAGDVFLYDRETAITTRISVRTGGGQALGSSGSPTVSADGRWVAFVSYATNLVEGDTNGMADVFLHDRDARSTQRISVRSDGGQATGLYGSLGPAISPDGRWVSYVSHAANLVDGDTNNVGDVFLYDRADATTRRISVRSNGAQATRASDSPAISSDGRWITYTSDAPDLVDDDTNNMTDVFLFDRDTAITRRISVSSNGTQATSSSGGPTISADGRWISYSSYAPDLVDDDTNNGHDVFLYDRDTAVTRRISVSSNGTQANAACLHPAISADGRWIAYDSWAESLVDTDTNAIWDVFLTQMW
jgi:Tol biopolymer transport system component